MAFITLGYMGATAPSKGAAAKAPVRKPLPKKETAQVSTSVVATHFKKLGIPLGRPDPKLAFWRQPAPAIAAQLQNAINSVPMPPGGTAPGVSIVAPAMPLSPVAPAPKPTALRPAGQKIAPASGIDAASLERKRVSVAKAFEAAKVKHKKARPKDADKLAVNAVAAHFKRAGVPLARPDAKLPFWRQSEKVIADRLAAVVNAYKV